MRFTGRAMLTHTRLGLWVAAQTRAGGAAPPRPAHAAHALCTRGATFTAQEEKRLVTKRSFDGKGQSRAFSLPCYCPSRKN